MAIGLRHAHSVLKVAGVTLAGIDLMTVASSIHERAMPGDSGSAVIRLAVRGRSFDQPEASTRHHRERFGVVGGSHQVGGTP
jgi:hypothetical protein